MTDIRINQLPAEASPVATDVVPIDGATTRKTTIQDLVLIGRPTASQAEAETGTNPTKVMTPLTTKQSIASEVGVSLASAAQGLLADGAAQKAQNLNDLADKGAAQDNIQLGAAFADVSTAQSATIAARNKRLRTQFYATASRIGGANYRRISFADLSTYPALAYFRSADRFMPDGSSDNTNGGYWVIDEAYLAPTMFGSPVDGVSDDSAAIIGAGATAKLLGRPLVLEYGHYRGASIALDCNGTFFEGAYITFNGAIDGYCIDISGNNREWGRISAKGNEMDCTPVQITGSGNKVASISSSDVTATAAGGLSFCGVRVQGNNNKLGKIFAENFLNDGHSNGSFPQAVLFLGTDNTFDTIDVRNGRAGLVLGSLSGTTRGGIINAFDMVDNGIYQLGGHLDLTTLNYQGDEEPCVFIGSASVSTVNLYGSCLGVGMQSTKRVSIGRINLLQDASGASPLFAFRTRPTSSALGELFIGAITGEFQGSTLFLVETGNPLGYLSVATMDVTFIYDAAVATSLSSWADIRGCSGFSFGPGRVQVVDKNSVATGSTIFQMQVATSITRPSFFNNLDVVITLPDKTTLVGQFRGINFAQPTIHTTGVKWRTDIGPYIDGTSANPSDDNASNIPTAGSWLRGKRLLNSFPAAGGSEGWVCVTAGTPGTWKAFGSIAA